MRVTTGIASLPSDYEEPSDGIVLAPNFFFAAVALRAWPRSASIQMKSSPSVQANRFSGTRNRANSKPFFGREFVASERLKTFNNTGEMGLDAFHLFGSRNLGSVV
jgi:hypothetical protein